jgi:hypothetical protein
MIFRFYRDAICQASRSLAAAIFIVGLLLIGFGVLIIAYSEIFAFLAALVFFVAGIGCGMTAVRIFLAQRELEKLDPDDTETYRRNVQIHSEEHYDA